MGVRVPPGVLYFRSLIRTIPAQHRYQQWGLRRCSGRCIHVRHHRLRHPFRALTRTCCAALCGCLRPAYRRAPVPGPRVSRPNRMPSPHRPLRAARCSSVTTTAQPFVLSPIPPIVANMRPSTSWINTDPMYRKAAISSTSDAGESHLGKIATSSPGRKDAGNMIGPLWRLWQSIVQRGAALQVVCLSF